MARNEPPNPALPELSSATTDAVRWITRIGLIVLGLAVVALVIYVRVRLANVPLERDEGEYGYAGQLILNGIPPYQLAYNMKFPGTYYAYAALMSVFGQTAWGIRMGLLCVHFATAALLFELGRRLVGALAGGLGAIAFMLLALDMWSMGVFAHATHFVLLPAVAGLLLLQMAAQSQRPRTFVAAGFLIGVAIIMKQQALFFGLMAIGLAIWSGRTAASSDLSRWRRGVLVAGGIAASLALLFVVLAFAGVLGRFWFWTFQYGSAYASEIPLSMASSVLSMAWGYITTGTGWMWYSGLAGLVMLFVVRWTSESRRFLVAWFIAAALSVAPGFFFRAHYFILLMPIVGLLVGACVASIERVLSNRMGAAAARGAALAVFTAIAALCVTHESHFLFRIGETELMRKLYDTNPFLESPAIADYIKAHTRPEDKIAVIGSEPQILFYSQRQSATGYMYMYPLMEAQPYASQMQLEMRREVEAAKPLYFLYVGVSASWGMNARSDSGVIKWASDYAQRCYDRVGIVDIDADKDATFVWDSAVAGYQPHSRSQVMTFRRNGKCDR